MNDLSKGNLNIRLVMTIIGATVIFVLSFVKTVIIPINNMQIQLASIQATLSDTKASFDSLVSKTTDLENRISKLENTKK